MKKVTGKRVVQSLIILLILALSLLRIFPRLNLTGWLGPTNIEVIEEYRERFVPLHQNLQEIAVKLSSEPSISEVFVQSEISPRPVFIQEEPSQSNIAFTSLDEILVPDRAWNEDSESLAFTPEDVEFTRALNWTGEHSRLSNSVKDNNGASMQETLENALKVEYILLGRMVDRKISPSGRFMASRCDAFLVHIHSQEIVARVPIDVEIGGERTISSQVLEATISQVKQALGHRANIQWKLKEFLL